MIVAEAPAPIDQGQLLHCRAPFGNPEFTGPWTPIDLNVREKFCRVHPVAGRRVKVIANIKNGDTFLVFGRFQRTGIVIVMHQAKEALELPVLQIFAQQWQFDIFRVQINQELIGIDGQAPTVDPENIAQV